VGNSPEDEASHPLNVESNLGLSNLMSLHSFSATESQRADSSLLSLQPEAGPSAVGQSGQPLFDSLLPVTPPQDDFADGISHSFHYTGQQPLVSNPEASLYGRPNPPPWVPIPGAETRDVDTMAMRGSYSVDRNYFDKIEGELSDLGQAVDPGSDSENSKRKRRSKSTGGAKRQRVDLGSDRRGSGGLGRDPYEHQRGKEADLGSDERNEGTEPQT
jgi:hypothetical protein